MSTGQPLFSIWQLPFQPEFACNSRLVLLTSLSVFETIVSAAAPFCPIAGHWNTYGYFCERLSGSPVRRTGVRCHHTDVSPLGLSVRS